MEARSERQLKEHVSLVREQLPVTIADVPSGVRPGELEVELFVPVFGRAKVGIEGRDLRLPVDQLLREHRHPLMGPALNHRGDQQLIHDPHVSPDSLLELLGVSRSGQRQERDLSTVEQAERALEVHELFARQGRELAVEPRVETQPEQEGDRAGRGLLLEVRLLQQELVDVPALSGRPLGGGRKQSARRECRPSSGEASKRVAPAPSAAISHGCCSK